MERLDPETACVSITYSRKTAHCKVIPGKRNLKSLNIIKESQLLNQFEANVFSPTTTIQKGKLAFKGRKVLLDDRK
jgi:hypothetical protein